MTFHNPIFPKKRKGPGNGGRPLRDATLADKARDDVMAAVKNRLLTDEDRALLAQLIAALNEHSAAIREVYDLAGTPPSTEPPAEPEAS